VRPRTCTSSLSVAAASEHPAVSAPAAEQGEDTSGALPTKEVQMERGRRVFLMACFACHQTLDPTRSILSSTYSWNYHAQTDSALSTAFRTSRSEGSSEAAQRPSADPATCQSERPPDHSGT